MCFRATTCGELRGSTKPSSAVEGISHAETSRVDTLLVLRVLVLRVPIM